MASVRNMFRKKRGSADKPHKAQASSDTSLRAIRKWGLCEACTMIGLNCDYPTTHHTPALLGASAESCSMCKFIDNHYNGERSFRSAEVSVDLVNSILRYRIPNAGGGGQMVYEIFNKKGTPLSTAGPVNFRRLSPNSMSDDGLKLFQTWLNDCHSTHAACRRDSEFSLPTRVIDVTGSKPYIREIQQINAPYVTLSHCWGDKPTLTLTKSTLSDYKTGIRVSDMPQAFQDAVAVTKRLRVSYLWIDSLCIIQDFVQDWVAECPKMRSYYRNSYVTISALESPDSQHGFLAPRDTDDIAQLPNIPNAWIRPKSLDRGKVFQKACLNHRGWALQERLLSTCILHFTEQEMFWECQTCSARESSVVENRGTTNFHLLVSSEGEDFKRSLQSVGKDRFSQQDGAFALWIRLIRQYSRRSLTFSSDKLPAISGLAARLATKTKSKYIAGLWEDDLHGLAWFKDGPYELISHATVENDQGGYLAPSWSWVKMNKSITYRFNEEERVTSVKDPILINSDVQSRDSDPFGCLISCSIRVQALTKPVQCMLGRSLSSHRDLVFGFLDPEDLLQTSFDALPVNIYAADGTPVGTGSFDEIVDESCLHLCKAVRIAERCYERGQYSNNGDGEDLQYNRRRPIKQSVVYFLLIQPDDDNDGAWKRVGAGITRNFVERLHYSDFFDLWDWEELLLK